MARTLERLRAEKLRKRGWSIIKISKRLNIAKSTASIWCKDILLTKEQKNKLVQNSIIGGHRGRMLGSATNHQRKLDIISKYLEEGKVLLSDFSLRDLLIAGTCLYWAEGSKTGGRIIFVNSDPDMVLIAYRFVTEILGVSKENLRMTIQINHIHEKRINKVMKFWSKLLSLPFSKFSKPYYVNVIPKKTYSNYNEYYGVARLRVLKSSSLQYKVLGLINAIKQHKLPM